MGFITCGREACLLGKSSAGRVWGFFSLGGFFPSFPPLLHSFGESPSPPSCSK